MVAVNIELKNRKIAAGKNNLKRHKEQLQTVKVQD